VALAGYSSEMIERSLLLSGQPVDVARPGAVVNALSTTLFQVSPGSWQPDRSCPPMAKHVPVFNPSLSSRSPDNNLNSSAGSKLARSKLHGAACSSAEQQRTPGPPQASTHTSLITRPLPAPRVRDSTRDALSSAAGCPGFPGLILTVQRGGRPGIRPRSESESGSVAVCCAEAQCRGQRTPAHHLSQLHRALLPACAAAFNRDRPKKTVC